MSTVIPPQPQNSPGKKRRSEQKNSKKPGEPEINYGQIIKRSFEITRKKSFLWIFGIILAFFGGGGGGFSNPVSFRFGGNEKAEIENAAQELGLEKAWTAPEKFWTGKGEALLTQTGSFITNHWELLGLGVLALIVLAICLGILGIIARGGLIDGINKKDSRLTAGFKDSTKVGWRSFWRMLGISLFTSILILTSLVIIGVPVLMFFAAGQFVVGASLAGLGFVLFIAITISLKLIARLARMFVVLAQFSLFSAYGEAYNLLTKKLSKILIAWLIQIIIRIAGGMIMSLLFIPLVLLLVILGGGLYFGGFGWSGLAVAIALGVLLLIALGLFCKAILIVFTESVWVLFFKEIAGEKIDDGSGKEPAKLAAVAKAASN